MVEVMRKAVVEACFSPSEMHPGDAAMDTLVLSPTSEVCPRRCLEMQERECVGERKIERGCEAGFTQLEANFWRGERLPHSSEVLRASPRCGLLRIRHSLRRSSLKLVVTGGGAACVAGDRGVRVNLSSTVMSSKRRRR